MKSVEQSRPSKLVVLSAEVVEKSKNTDWLWLTLPSCNNKPIRLCRTSWRGQSSGLIVML